MSKFARLSLAAGIPLLICLVLFAGKDFIRLARLKAVAPVPEPPPFSPRDLFTGEGTPLTAEDFDPNVMIPQQPAITKLDVTQADRVTDEVKPDELVLGVVIDGQARAYPINVLTNPNREIFNDVLADQPIAATW